MAKSPASIIYDVNGTKAVGVIDDVDTSADKRLLVEADIKPGAQIVVTTLSVNTGSVADSLLNGSSSDMVVDGSSTPVTFKIDADGTDDMVLNSLRLVLSAQSLLFNGDAFGKGGGALPTGVQIKITANGGTFVETLITLNVNEDMLRLLEFSIFQGGSTDVMAASVVFGGRVVLNGGSSDKIEVVINDDFTAGNRGINYFTATMYGVME